MRRAVTFGLVWVALGGGVAYMVSTFGVTQFWGERPDELAMLLRQHLLLVVLSCLLAVAVAVPVAILITRPGWSRYATGVTSVANIGQSIPTLAILALVLGLLGIGNKPAVFALWVHSLMPILRNTAEGIRSVDPALVDAGRGMGMTGAQLLRRVELPNSVTAIMAGVRTAVVVNIGTAALAFLIGGGGLGDWIFTGISLHEPRLILAGAVPVAGLAVLSDRLLGWLELALTPRGLKRPVVLEPVA